MLRIIQNISVAGAMKYFARSDYFIDGQELAGSWHGRAAGRLGLHGEVKKSDWDAMCQNLNPATGEPLTVRQKDHRRVGYDFNFRAPKGLSLLYGLTGDERLLSAFRESVEETMRDMEAEMQTRVRREGRDEDRTTGNMAWGEWVHFTSRPVDGVPDPHLHAHCFVFNATWDSHESRWKAGQFAGLKRDAPYFEARFHSRLAEKLGDLGLAVERQRNSWDLAGLPRALQLKFSRRMALVEAAAKAKGITDPQRKSEVSAQTRERKRTDLSLTELREQWSQWLTGEEAEAVQAATGRIGGPAIQRDSSAPAHAAELAVSHVFERRAVVPERTLLREALRRSLGQAGVGNTEHAVASQPLIHTQYEGRKVVTTLAVLEEEQRMIDFARSGRGTCPSLAPGEHEFRETRLNPQQRKAVIHVLHSGDRVMVVRGAAGVGKTTMMREAVTAIEAAGTRVFTFAPSADASRGVLREEEGFATADTVAALLASEKLQSKAAGGVLWIDEAGLLGTKSMKAIFDLAERIDCRVVLSGDRRQHGSVERGDALRLLETHAGIVPAEIKEIQRQWGQYKSAVAALSDGRTEEGFRQLDGLGWVREVKDSAERERAIAAEYVQSLSTGQSCLVVSPTHAEGDRLTKEIRQQLQNAGKVEADAVAAPTLISLSLTEAERSDPASYSPGDVVVFHQNAPGHCKGDRLTVGEVGGAGAKAVPFDQAKRFSVYRQGTLELAAGDLIRITAGGSTVDGKHRVNNGAVYQVQGFSKKGEIVLKNGWKLARDFGHLSYGYVSTSHASQGKTKDRVILSQSAESFPAASREQFYVSVSRGRRQALVFTDEKAELLRAVSRSDDRLAATDLLAYAPRRQRLIALSQHRSRNTRAVHRPSKRSVERPGVDRVAVALER